MFSLGTEDGAFWVRGRQFMLKKNDVLLPSLTRDCGSNPTPQIFAANFRNSLPLWGEPHPEPSPNPALPRP